MMRLERASMIAMLFLLAWAATGGAECAWVLWVIWAEGSGEIKLARETLKGCGDELNREAKHQIELLAKVGFAAPHYRESDETHQVMTFLDSKNDPARHVIVRFQCLPDTSPRPPKP